ncbi:MAG TPA: hypothetical protein VIZ86_16030 [Pseudomonas sp.]
MAMLLNNRDRALSMAGAGTGKTLAQKTTADCTLMQRNKAAERPRQPRKNRKSLL